MRIVLLCALLCLITCDAIGDSNPVQWASVRQMAPRHSSPTPTLHAAGRPEATPFHETTAAASRNEPGPTVYSRQDLCDAIFAAAEKEGVPSSFLARLIWQESGFRTNAISRAGAQGIAQFMPETAAKVGLKNPFDPDQALPASARLLHELHGEFGNHGLAAAAYNAGSQRVREWLARRSRLPAETRNYVLNITGRQPEQWIGVKAGEVNLPVPSGTGCQQAAKAVASAGAARWTRRVVRPRVAYTRVHGYRRVQYVGPQMGPPTALGMAPPMAPGMGTPMAPAAGLPRPYVPAGWTYKSEVH
jgi:hypothetical protein